MIRRLSICLAVFLGLGLAWQVQAATLYTSPSSGSYTVGKTFSVTIRVNTSGQAINASEGTITWSTSTLQFVSVSSSGSIFKYWPIDPTVQGSSTVIFSGGLPNPGYTGSAGTIVTITFKAKSAGTATVSVLGGKILANDGQGTDLYTGQGSATYTITTATSSAPSSPSVPSRPTPSVSSSTHPNQTAWYTATTAKLSWSASGATGFSTQLTREASTTPDDVVDTTNTTATETLTEDGVWYYHVKAKYSTGWSATAHFALHLDRTLPEAFTPEYQAGTGASGYGQILASTTDVTSGVARYTYAIDGAAAQEGTTTFDLGVLTSGTHSAVVTAYDAAGNARQATLEFSITGYTPPTLTSLSSPLLLLDPIVLRGSANAGDTITVYVNGQSIGQLIVAPDTDVPSDGSTVRFPWVFTSDRLFRPGTYTVTVTATSTSGQVSAPTASRELHVIGQAVVLNGRPVAVWAALTPFGILALSLLALIVAVFARLGVAVWVMHRHERLAEDELEALRTINQRQGVTKAQLDQAIEQIEEDLEGKPVRTKTRRRSSKRTR